MTALCCCSIVGDLVASSANTIGSDIRLNQKIFLHSSGSFAKIFEVGETGLNWPLIENPKGHIHCERLASRLLGDFDGRFWWSGRTIRHTFSWVPWTDALVKTRKATSIEKDWLRDCWATLLVVFGGTGKPRRTRFPMGPLQKRPTCKNLFTWDIHAKLLL